MTRDQKALTLIFSAAALSLVSSVLLWFLVDKSQGMFVGLWVPSILALGALVMVSRKVST